MMINSKMRSASIIVTLAILMVPVGYFLLRKEAPDANRFVADSFERNTGLSGDSLYDLMSIQKKMGAHKPISENEWKHIDDASHSKALEFRVNALNGLPSLEGTPYRDRAHALMRRLVSDPDPATAAMALTLLVETHDEETPQLFEEAKKNPSSIMQGQISFLAKKWKM